MDDLEVLRKKMEAAIDAADFALSVIQRFEREMKYARTSLDAMRHSIVESETTTNVERLKPPINRKPPRVRNEYEWDS